MTARIAATMCGLLSAVSALAQTPLGTSLTYQGRLDNSGSPANGLHDMQFQLFTALSGGSQVGSTICRDGVNVVDGLFTVSLDFGAAYDGNQRFLAIGVRPDSTAGNCASGSYTALTPRQPLSAVPYALYALSGPGSSGPWAVSGNNIFNTNAGNVGIGNAAPGEKLTVAGRIHSTTGGVRFPDATIQTTAGGACVRTIADLRALPIPSGAAGDPATVQVLGYYAAGDGAAGQFYWDAASTEADEGGIIIASNSAPPAGRWKRVFTGAVHAEWWGIPYPGPGADTVGLQAAFNAAAGRGIVFDRSATYLFDPPLVVPDSVTIENDGRAQFVLASPILDSAIAVTLGQNVSADYLDISVPAGVVARNLLWLGHGNDIQHIKLSSVIQLNNIFADSNYDGALQIRSQDVRIGTLEIERIDKGIVFYDAHHVVIEHMKINEYRTGMHAAASSFLYLKSGEIAVPAVPRPGVVAGNNGLLFDTCEDITVSNVSVSDAGEHAIRIGGAGYSSRFAFSNIQSIRPGGCGFKVFPQVGYRARDIEINGLTVVDAGFSATGVAPDVNENGIQLQNCDYVTVNGFQVEYRGWTYSAFIGIKVSDAANITFNGPRVTNVKGVGIQLDDDFGYVNSVFINSPVVLGAGQDGILIQSPNQILRDIIITRCYVRSFAGYGVRVAPFLAVNQPIILDGFVRNDVGLGAVQIQASSSNIKNLIVAY